MRVRRGSEQYRALVADAPVIGTVSNSLGGDVIVVVGSRAYHIY
jgi:3-hydroxyisobutyrate dehydrogenase-like beta-hydroxyacid dehydrogenase